MQSPFATRLDAIETANGLVPADHLGFTLVHEHVFTRTLGVAENWPGTFDRGVVTASCVKALGELRALGVHTIVDHSTFDIGRDVGMLRDVAVQSEVQVVVPTGTWVTVPRYFEQTSADQMAGMWVSEIERGIAGTGVRAGVIKVCLESSEPSALERKAIHAAALAHLATGAPISTHTSCKNDSAQMLIDLLLAHGVEPSRVLLGHVGDTTDVDYLVALAASGCFLGLDRFGAESVLDDGARIATLLKLVDLGYEQQLLLSHDASCWSGWRTAQELRERHPAWTMTRLATHILPELRSAGFDASMIDLLTVSNPRRFLCGSPGRLTRPKELSL